MTEKFVGRVHLLVNIMIVNVIFTTYDIIGVLYIYIYIIYIYALQICRYLKRPYRTYGRAG